jgi:lyso-ornithine lipid O-acyltransferase
LKIRLYSKISLIVLLFIVGLLISALVYPALGLLGTKKFAKHERDRLKSIWFRCFNRIVGLRISTEGKLLEKSAFLVSNHISWVDIAVLSSFFPAHFVAKSDILSWPVIGYLAKQGGTIFIRRGDKKQVMATAEKMVWLIKQNCTVIVFPEGTTTSGDEVLPFHASLFQPALLTKTTVQPVALHYLGESKQQVPFIGDDAFLPHLIKMLGMDKIEVRVDFLPAVSPAGKNRNSISYEAREMISESITQEHHRKGIAISV